MLFVCTHNSARGQMAEGLLRELDGDRFEAFSAGIEATHVRPLAIRSIMELGILLGRCTIGRVFNLLAYGTTAVLILPTVELLLASAIGLEAWWRRRHHWGTLMGRSLAARGLDDGAGRAIS